MKRTGEFISVLAAAIVLVSCSQEFAETGGEEQSVVSFSTLLTRGSSIESAKNVADAGGFSVWAFKYTGDWNTAVNKTILIDNGDGYGEVTSDDGLIWDYGSPQYWPIVQKVSFFACAPHGYASWGGALDIGGIPVITCTVPASIVEQKDLMIATPVYDATGPDPVQEKFHHALSRITFSAIKADDMMGKEVKINSISIEGIYSMGTASLVTPVEWSNTSSIQNYELSVLDGSLRDKVLDSELDFDPSNPEKYNLLPTNEFLFLMPQDFPPNAKLVIDFTTDSKDLRWSGDIPAPSKWLAGNSYHYKLLIDGDMIVVICGELESPINGAPWGSY